LIFRAFRKHPNEMKKMSGLSVMNINVADEKPGDFIE